ncbi:multiple epidermal growth factor-like domains protein 10 [Saccostrea cucullata]|uniref:multiple epidermal growth factor-like domains protein 10 n=1 Tax=Saccostrea cuccullata TaxID=36930 RepID=UPI002ED28004
MRTIVASFLVTKEIRQRGRFAGFSLYLSNTTSKDDGYLCYKDGPELPPLDFNTTCIKHGRYLTFYNERLLKISYPDEYESMVITELCEVMVYGCENSAVYGSNCNTSCPSKCQEQRCDLINGTCLGCVLGWKGDFCDQSCLAGTFGLECNGSCSGQCKDNETCDHVTGLCPNGCAHGWTGSYCQRRCPLGTYGRNCIYNCSGHCLQNTYCERENGHCLNGCDPGYIGQLCDTECPQHTFGKDCKDNCSGHCLNGETCRYNDGVCNNGCIAGYIGIRCEKVCPEGFYGSSCTAVCSKSCIDICEHTDGKCSCAPGWMGSPNCSEVAANIVKTVKPVADLTGAALKGVWSLMRD